MLIQGNMVFENAVYNAKRFVLSKSWGKINNLLTEKSFQGRFGNVARLGDKDLETIAKQPVISIQQIIYKFCLSNYSLDMIGSKETHWFNANIDNYKCFSSVPVNYMPLQRNFFRNANYSRTSPQWPPLGQRKVAVVKRWPLWGGRGVIWQIIFWGYKMFTLSHNDVIL